MDFYTIKLLSIVILIFEFFFYLFFLKSNINFKYEFYKFINDFLIN